MKPGGPLGALLTGLLPALLVAVAVPADAGAQAGEGAVAGRVIDESGAPLAGVCVGANNESLSASGETGTDGTYRIDRLPAGSFKVAFYRCYDDSRNLLRQYYRDKPTYAAADPITVSAGKTTSGIDARMHPGGIVAGRVTTSSGGALEGACVRVYRQETQESAITDATGEYEVSALPSGTYKVEFSGCSGRGSEFYSHKPDEQSANAVSVTAPATTGSIDGVVPGGAITGRMLDNATGQPVADSCVSVRSTTGPTFYTNRATTASGRYVLSGLDPGTYRLRFESDRRLTGDVFFGCYSSSNYQGEWYEDDSTYETASTLTVAEGATVGPLDGRLTRLASVAGTVRDESGKPVYRVCVDVTSSSGQTTSALTGPDGRYYAELLHAGAYRVEFTGSECAWWGPGPGPLTPPRYESSWWNGKSSAAAADALQVGAGKDVTGIDGVVKPVVTQGHGFTPSTVVNVQGPAGAPTAGPDPPEIAGTTRVMPVRVSARGLFTLPRQVVDCTGVGPDCKVKASIRWRGAQSSARGSLKTIGGSRFTVRAGRRARVRVRLNRTGRRLLRRGRGSLRARADIRVVRGTRRAGKSVRVTLVSARRP